MLLIPLVIGTLFAIFAYLMREKNPKASQYLNVANIFVFVACIVLYVLWHL